MESPIYYLVYLLIFIEAMLSSWLLNFIFPKLAAKSKLIDLPHPRKIHSDPRPLTGGAAIFLAFTFTVLGNLAILFFLAYFLSNLNILQDIIQHIPGVIKVLPSLGSILVSGSVIFLVGLYDDKYIASPKLKLIVQIIAATMVVFSGTQFTLFAAVPQLGLAIFTVLWIVGITNSFNLLDNMDGLVAGVAAIGIFFFIIICAQLGQFFIIVILLALLGAILGFLPFNINPASIFMGDSGSMFIGFILAIMTVKATFYTTGCPTFFPIFMPLVVMAVPLFDTLSVIYIRLKHHLPLTKGDQNHLSHRLVRLGMEQRDAVSFIYLLTFCTGLVGILLRKLDSFGAIVVMLQCLVVFGLIVLLERIHFKPHNPHQSSSSSDN